MSATPSLKEIIEYFEGLERYCQEWATSGFLLRKEAISSIISDLKVLEAQGPDSDAEQAQRAKETVVKIKDDYFESRALGLNEKNFGYWSGRMDGLGTALQALGILDKDFKMPKSESELAMLNSKELE